MRANTSRSSGLEGRGDTRLGCSRMRAIKKRRRNVKVEQFVKSFVIPLEEDPRIQEDQSIAQEIEKILHIKGW